MLLPWRVAFNPPRLLKSEKEIHMKNYDAMIEELIGKMSLHEKIGQLNQPETPRVDKADEFREKVRRGEVGSILMSVGATAGNDPQGAIDVNFYNEMQRIAVEESPSGIPILFGRDVIHGHRTVLPIPLAMAASFNPEKVGECYHDVAEEAMNESVHWTFTPMLDLARDPRWGRIIEGCGEDPYVGARMAEAIVKGLQGEDLTAKDSMLACAKHFVGYGAAEGGRDYHRAEISDYTLYNYYLPAFRAAVNAGAKTVMCSFNEISGEAVTASRKYLTDILRGHMGFDGFVVSDYACVEQLIPQGLADNRADASAMAIKAGLDMDMWDHCYINTLEGEVEKGNVSMEVIDEAVRRVLRVKAMKGLFDAPYCDPVTLDRTEHLARARELARESIVLLKNEGNLLPLAKNSSIALIGPFANERRSLLGSWTIDGKAEETPTLREAICEVGGAAGVKVHTSVGTGLDYNIAFGPISMIYGDVAVVAIGESWAVTGENKAVSNISIPADQIELLKRVKMFGKKVVAVLFCGRPIAMEGIAEYCDAIIYAWHAGSRAAHAVADILFGDANPSGRLPVTMPRLATHIPLYYNVTSSGRPVNCYYGQNPGNCCFDSVPTPYYPFGYGLSYTTFAYGTPVCDTPALSREELASGKRFRVTVDVKNTGERDGKETVQLYIHDPVAKMMRPLRELKAYAKTFIPAGKTVTVELSLGKEELGYYLPDGSYTLEAGKIELYVGENCLTTRKIEITVL